jgi:hypothetical protein
VEVQRLNPWKAWYALIAASLVTSATMYSAELSPTDAIAFLQSNWRISANDIQTIRGGDPIGKVLKSNEDGEIAILGAIKIARSKEQYIAWYKNVENFKFSPMILDVGLIGNPPQPDSMKRATFDSKEFVNIRSCEAGNCPIKLTAQEIQRFTSGVDWSTANYAEQANVRLRQMWLNYVQNYLNRGNAALGCYQDKPDKVDLAKVFEELLDAAPWLRENFPESLKQLREYAGTSPLADNEFVYWSKERYGFGMKPILSLFHVTILKAKPEVTLIASKQIRSSHYFDGSLGLTLVFDAPDAGNGAKESYLVYVNRSRLDLLRGGLWGMKRSLVQRQLPGEIKKQLVLIKKSVEAR